MQSLCRSFEFGRFNILLNGHIFKVLTSYPIFRPWIAIITVMCRCCSVFQSYKLWKMTYAKGYMFQLCSVFESLSRLETERSSKGGACVVHGQAAARLATAFCCLCRVLHFISSSMRVSFILPVVITTDTNQRAEQ